MVKTHCLYGKNTLSSLFSGLFTTPLAPFRATPYKAACLVLFGSPLQSSGSLSLLPAVTHILPKHLHRLRVGLCLCLLHNLRTDTIRNAALFDLLLLALYAL